MCEAHEHDTQARVTCNVRQPSRLAPTQFRMLQRRAFAPGNPCTDRLVNSAIGKTFTDRANAKLPVTEPDQVLLALIKGNRHIGCNERLIPAVTAQPLPPDKTAETPPVEPAPLLTPPMALAGPKTTETDGGNIAAPPEELAPKTARR